ncbi:MAG: hypothetical protein PHC28_11460 [Flavobacterium sp.]|uniref:hypothetical protein n=1 Tax=Flavobacterium sp. TaxID=239 RepID=UPI002609517F|nr:hypothetical protein [Flavobacterium sp.]MDD5151071.1 hypothetical protein [Flavobacterium sp.]
MNKETLLTDWNFMRILRLGLGIYIAFQAFETHSIFSGVVAVFFLFQAITNTGCCGSNGCAVPTKKSNSDSIEEIEYKEIK